MVNFIEGSCIVIENILYIEGCEFSGVIVLLLDIALWQMCLRGGM